MEVPRCVKHPTSKVVRAGWYGRPGHRRQRWWCHPKRAKAHRFTEVVPRICRHDGPDAVCEVCATHLEPWEGQPSARLYGFTAVEVAEALRAVAGGATYRSAAGSARTRAGRELATRVTKVKSPRGRRMRDPNHHGQLVSDWVEVFAPVLWSAYAPKSWPAGVLLDDKEFTYRPVKTKGGVRPKSRRAFVVHAAVAHLGGAPVVVAVAADRYKSVPSWMAFLSSLPGRPQVVVGDRGEPVKAARALWANASPPVAVRHCEWHLGKNLRDALPAGVAQNPAHRIHKLVRAAFVSQQDWARLRRAAAYQLRKDPAWKNFFQVAEGMDATVMAQVPPLPAPRTGPTSTGPVETFLRDLGPVIGDRAHAFTNKKRTTALLQLVALNRNGWGTTNDWAKVIRTHLDKSKGTAPAQRRHVDRLNAPSLRPRSRKQAWTKPPVLPPGSRAKPTVR